MTNTLKTNCLMLVILILFFATINSITFPKSMTITFHIDDDTREAHDVNKVYVIGNEDTVKEGITPNKDQTHTQVITAAAPTAPFAPVAPAVPAAPAATQNKSIDPKLRIACSASIRNGYNILKGNPNFIKASNAIDPGFTTTIFQTFKDASTEGYTFTEEGTCKTSFSHQVIKSVTELENTFILTLGLELSKLSFSLELNASLKSIQKSLESNENIYIIQESSCATFNVDINLYSPPEFTIDFIEGLKTLDRKTWAQAKEEYGEFFANFGTHIMKDITMGSKYYYTMEMSRSAYDKYNSKDMSLAASLSLMSPLQSGKAQASMENSKVEKSSFEKELNQSWKTSVGAPISEEATWLESSKTKAMPIEYKLLPISDLFTKPEIKKRLVNFGFDAESLSKNIKEALLLYVKENSNTSDTIRNTNWNDSDNGNIFNLDRHDVKCEKNEAIKGFILENKENTISYKATCVKSIAITDQCISKSTSPNDTDKPNKSSIYLDRHEVNCGDYVLRSFKLARQGDKLIYYTYSCCKVDNNAKNIDKSTVKSSLGDSSTKYLDQLYLMADDGSALSYFKLFTQGALQYLYKQRNIQTFKVVPETPGKSNFVYTKVPSISNDICSQIDTPAAYGFLEVSTHRMRNLK